MLSLLMIYLPSVPSFSGGEPHQEGVLWFSWLAGIVLGSMIGAGQVLEGHARRGRRNVVITGRYVTVLSSEGDP